MRKMCKPLSVLCAVLILMPAGCDWMKEHQGAVTGAAIGAAGGGLLGAAVSGRHSRGRGIVIGAVLGALAGGAIGEYMSQRDRTAQQAAQATNYQPTQGIVLQIDNAAATPPTIAGSGQVMLSVSYTLLAPNAAQGFAVAETTIVTDPNGNKVAEIAPPPGTNTRQPGSYTSQVPLILPAGAAKGTYQVLFSVSLPSGVPVQRTAAFTVS